MIYIWRIPDNYPQKLIGEYDAGRSPDRFEFRKGVVIKKKLSPVIIKFSCNISDIDNYDCLPNSSQLPLVNKRVRDILDACSNLDVQYFNAIIECQDGRSDEYCIVNVVHAEKVINHELSKFDFIEGSNVILGFNRLVFKENCLSEFEIARDAEYKSHIIVSENIFSVFEKNDITGVQFITSEEFNSAIYA